MVFPVLIYGCESWTIKKAEHWRIDAFELWCWRRLLRVPWTARRSNQPILKEISPEYSLEGLMLRLKLQYFGYLTHLKRPWCSGRLKAGGEGDNRGWYGWMASLTQWAWVWITSGSWWWTGRPGVLQSMGSQRVRYNWATELNWIVQGDHMICCPNYDSFENKWVLLLKKCSRTAGVNRNSKQAMWYGHLNYTWLTSQDSKTCYQRPERKEMAKIQQALTF